MILTNGAHTHSRKLHCKPSSFAIRSNLMSGVLPTASRALSKMCRAPAIAERGAVKAAVDMSVEDVGS